MFSNLVDSFPSLAQSVSVLCHTFIAQFIKTSVDKQTYICLANLSYVFHNSISFFSHTSVIFIIPICLVSTQGTKNVLRAAYASQLSLWSHHLVLFRSISLSIFVFQASMKI